MEIHAAPRLAPGAWVYLESPADMQPAVPPAWTLHREGRTREVRYALYRAPGLAAWEAADRAVDVALGSASGSVRNHLYQLRSALRDDESPLLAAVHAMPAQESPDAP